MKSVSRKNKRNAYDKYVMASWGRSGPAKMKREIIDKKAFKRVKYENLVND